jgi:hypothetical protein
MAAMRFLMWALRVINTEKAKKAIPPARSLRLVLSCGLGGWTSCVDGSEEEGPDVDGGSWSCFEDAFSLGPGVVASGFEPEPHPRKESIAWCGYIDLLRFAKTGSRSGRWIFELWRRRMN